MSLYIFIGYIYIYEHWYTHTFFQTVACMLQCIARTSNESPSDPVSSRRSSTDSNNNLLCEDHDKIDNNNNYLHTLKNTHTWAHTHTLIQQVAALCNNNNGEIEKSAVHSISFHFIPSNLTEFSLPYPNSILKYPPNPPITAHFYSSLSTHLSAKRRAFS